MPTFGTPNPSLVCPFDHHSPTQLGIVHRAAYDLVLEPYGH